MAKEKNMAKEKDALTDQMRKNVELAHDQNETQYRDCS